MAGHNLHQEFEEMQEQQLTKRYEETCQGSRDFFLKSAGL